MATSKQKMKIPSSFDEVVNIEEEYDSSDVEEITPPHYPLTTRKQPKTQAGSSPKNAKAGSSKKRSDSGIRKILQCDKQEEDAVFKSGRIARPRNPYFVANLRTCRAELYVPVAVIKDFCLKLKDQISIRDEEGRSWMSRVAKWKDGRVVLTDGWRKFCRWNHLKTENLCLCEFLNDKNGLFLKIQILHFDGESWLPRQAKLAT